MASGAGHRLRLDDISHWFGDFLAARDIALDIAGGEMLALLGPSGCGKSTLLRIIAGFIRQSAGRVIFDEEAVDHLPPSRRGVGIVFQNYALFPHMTVAQNVAYGLAARRWPRGKIAPRVAEMLARVHMAEFAARKPRQLSGGQQQRVALARCLATDPKLLLLDEPFGALDKNLRLDMQIEVKRLQRESGITTVLVTHDQEEALSMADRIAVMAQGAIEQIATPTEIYDRPQTLFVNQFVGTANLIPGELTDKGVRLPGGAVVPVADARGLAAGMSVLVAVRPEQLRLEESASGGRIAAVIRTVMPLGPQVVYEVEIAQGTSLKVSESRGPASVMRRPGDKVHVATTSPAACHVFAKG